MKTIFNKENDAGCKIGPDEIQLNTSLRKSRIRALSKEDMDKIEGYFEGLPVVSAYKISRKQVLPVNGEDTLIRRGKV